MDFVHFRLKNMRFSRPRCIGHSTLQVSRSTSVHELFSACLRNDPLPAMKHYEFMPSNQVDLDVRVPEVNSYSDLQNVVRKGHEYDSARELHEKETEADLLNKKKEDVKARIIAEYEASKASKSSDLPGVSSEGAQQ